MEKEISNSEERDLSESRREPLKCLFREAIEDAMRDHLKARIKPYLEQVGYESSVKEEGDRIFWKILKGIDKQEIVAEIREASEGIVIAKLPLDYFARDLIAEERISE